MAGTSKLQIDPTTGLPDIHDFAEFGAALRNISKDDESHRFSDGMGELSTAIERVGKALSSQKRGSTVGPLLIDLLTSLRKHRQFVVGLSVTWRGLYEYASYLAALNNFRVLIGQWLVDRNISGDNEVVIEDFELIGWRTLGEGLMMIDMHEQALTQFNETSATVELDESRLARAKNWWGQLRGKDNPETRI
ncbi:MAG: hypothetical protein EAZ37_02275 [Burkholderiales bacterium]|nr:MAG: hypothetical protein EAZ37_02275 [Burkholderiales bacterium]